MNKKPQKAFVLAAGKGTRLRPHTDTMPKPMVEVAGTSIIRRTIAKLKEAGVREIVVNTHHLGDIMASHLSGIDNPKIILSAEEELLETGGGIKKTLHHFNEQPFYIINGDALWDESGIPALQRLADSWDENSMDILLLLQPVSKMNLTNPVGDYHLNGNRKAVRAKEKDGEYMFAGIRIAHPRVFDNSPNGAFSFLSLMDKAETEGRLYGLAHSGNWYHISTADDLKNVNDAFTAHGKS